MGDGGEDGKHRDAGEFEELTSSDEEDGETLQGLLGGKAKVPKESSSSSSGSDSDSSDSDGRKKKPAKKKQKTDVAENAIKVRESYIPVYPPYWGIKSLKYFGARNLARLQGYPHSEEVVLSGERTLREYIWAIESREYIYVMSRGIPLQ